jgi:hypothetical protein
VKTLPNPRTIKSRAVRRPSTPNKKPATKPALDPHFVAAAKASKKKFGPLFKRLAKT